MSQLNVSIDTLPPGARVYQFSLVDTPGVVAANNYFSWFNPVASGKLLFPLGLVAQSYASGPASSVNSMQLFRISAASAGSLVTASSITRWQPGIDPDPVGQIRTTNPTVTTTGLPLLGIAPYNGSGGGGTVSSLVAPFDLPPLIPQGTGVVFGTAGGSAALLWNVQFTWMEL